MDLKFSCTGKVRIENRIYLCYKSCVHHNPLFWYAWKQIPEKGKNRYSLKKENGKFYLYKFIDQNNNFFILPKDTPKYYLQNKSCLLPYQVTPTAFLVSSLLSHNRAIDGSDTGTGKTFTALAAARELNLLPAIICKKSGIPGWKEACKYMRVTPLFIVNWEYAKAGKLPYIFMYRDRFDGSPVYRYGMPHNSILIFDECHVANNTGSQNNILYVSHRETSVRSISLSATLADKPARMEYIFSLLGYENAFKKWLKNRGTVDIHGKIESFTDKEDMREINKKLFPAFGYRVSVNDKSVKKYFPKAIFNTKLIPLTNEKIIKQNKAYTALVEKIKTLKGKEKQARVFTLQLRYRQLTEILKIDSIIDIANEYIEQKKSVVIFVNFLDTLKILSQKLNTRSLIFGEQEKYKINRQQVINDFQKNKTNIIISVMGAGGQSISLHDITGNSARIALVCPTWDSIQLYQVMGRVYRAGSKSTPVIQLIYAAGTIEERVSRRVNEKINNIRSLNTGDLIEDTIFQI